MNVATPTTGTNAATKAYVDTAIASVTSTISGTANYLPVFTGSNAIGNSAIYQTGGNVGIGTTSPNNKLEVNGEISTTGLGQPITARYNTGNDNYAASLVWNSSAGGVLTLGDNGINEIRGGRTITGGYLNFIVNNTAGDTAANNGTLALTLAANGTATFAQPVYVGTPTAAGMAATKAYVDTAVGGGGSGTFATVNAGQVNLTGAGLYNSSGYQIIQGNASDWLRINQNSSFANGTAAYGNWAFGNGGITVGSWGTAGAGNIVASGNISASQNVSAGVILTAPTVSALSNGGFAGMTSANEDCTYHSCDRGAIGHGVNITATGYQVVSPYSASLMYFGNSDWIGFATIPAANGTTFNESTLQSTYTRLSVTDSGITVNGTGNFTSQLNVATPTAGTSAATKAYVDTAIASVTSTISGTAGNIPVFTGANSIGNSMMVYSLNGSSTASYIRWNTGSGSSDYYAWYLNSQFNGSSVGTRTIQLWGYPYDAVNGCCHNLMGFTFGASGLGDTSYMNANFTVAGLLTANGLNANSNVITNLGTPTTGTMAATKAYVDSAVGGGSGPWTLSGSNVYTSTPDTTSASGRRDL